MTKALVLITEWAQSCGLNVNVHEKEAAPWTMLPSISVSSCIVEKSND